MAEHPYDPSHRRDLLGSVWNLALGLVGQGLRAEALPLFERRAEHLEALARARPGDLEDQANWAFGLSDLANLNLELDRGQTARGIAERAVTLYRQHIDGENAG